MGIAWPRWRTARRRPIPSLCWAWHLGDGLGSVRQLVDDSGQVTLAQGYTPFGEPLWNAGNASTDYGFTGERWEANSQLLFLRARYYEPGMGRFINKDPWPGSMIRPATLNGFSYVNNNPARLVDLLGLCDYDPYDPYYDYDCWVLAQEVANLTGMPVEVFDEQSYEYLVLLSASNPLPRIKDILDAGQVQGLCALIHYFECYSGPANEGLESLLRDTAGFEGHNIPIPIQAQFGIEIQGGECLCEDFEDQPHYETWGLTHSSYQISHFLSAVAMAYYNCGPNDLPFVTRFYRTLFSNSSDRPYTNPEIEHWRYSSRGTVLRMIIGHELVSDMAFKAWWKQYRAVDIGHIFLFGVAMRADLAGDIESIDRRDKYLEKITGLKKFSVDPERIGNSTEDLLLSLKGWEFGCMIKNRSITNAQGAATWLEDNLAKSHCCR
jgi:RHS repeat-associated protein